MSTKSNLPTFHMEGRESVPDPENCRLCRRFDKECDECGHLFEIYVDDNGHWIECACDMGYVDD